MCSLCYSTPCNPSCPNAPEPEVVFECCVCGGEIHDGQKYIDFEGDAVCHSCYNSMTIGDLTNLLDMTIEEILCELGGVKKVAEAE